MDTESCLSIAQNLHFDILILVVSTLSAYHEETYAPLICSHVCRSWHEAILNAPSLWAYIDTSRGEELTQLWLRNSGNAMLDVRLWDHPLQHNILGYATHHLTQKPFHTGIPATIQSVKRQCHRWRSLDIAFSYITAVHDILRFLSTDVVETLQLDSLTIGPMGRTSLVVDDGSDMNQPARLHLRADQTLARERFHCINVKPIKLRIDTYPISPSAVFSSQLTVLEVVAGNHYTHTLDLSEWRQILSQSPNLVELRLWHARHNIEEISNDVAQPTDLVVTLQNLTTLELTGAFISLSDFFIESQHPKLKHVLLDSIDESISLPYRIYSIASMSPTIRTLKIGSMRSNVWTLNAQWWAMLFHRTSFLQEITFFEMEWREIASALEHLAATPHELSCIRLERIYDLELRSLMYFKAKASLPRIKLINSTNGGRIGPGGVPGVLEEESDEGSSYVDSSSHVCSSHNLSASEEESSDGYESSYGSDEGSGIGNVST